MIGVARHPHGACGARGGPCPSQRAFALPATQAAIRAALADMRAALSDAGLDADACGTAEIALAEVLNNIAEHAYDATAPGTIRVTLTVRERTTTIEQGAALLVDAEITDTGAALPGLSLPATQLPALDVTPEALPEGGFGWFLIANLTESQSYTRQGQENHLRLSFAFRRRITDTTPAAG